MSNPAKILSPKEIEEIEMMAGLGLRYEDIALIKNMCDDTLKKYASDALSRGKAKAKAAVMQTAFKMATSGKVPAMTMFWLKTQAQWREAQTLINESQNLKEQVQNSNNPTQLIMSYLAETIEQVKRGEIAPTVASSVASVAGIFMKAVEQGSLEDRLSMLEAMNQTKDTQKLDMEF